MVQQGASLLPYLQPSEGSRGLRLQLLFAGGPGAGRSYPFRVLDHSPPYCRILEASLLTDAGVELRQLLLLLDKDSYSGSPPGQWHNVTNPDIERAWQSAREPLEGRGEGVFLASQTGPCGNLLRQAPLFYCRHRSLYFHPVCPSCGLELTLCTNDNFLRSAGLSPYSTSAKRYLYCHACCHLGRKEIYVYERDAVDPASLADRWSLLDRTGEVDELMDPEGALPCVRCPERGSCFGPQGEVRSRMVPLSFYPFHLLICDAPSLNGADFLALASGATPGELQELLDPLTEEGRLARLQALEQQGPNALFPPADPRSFLEALSLKLSFLEEVLRHALLQPVGTLPALDAVWVRLAPLGKGLPLFWNFRVEILERVIPSGAGRLGGEERAQLGLLWFQSLIGSRKTRGEVLHAVADYLALLQEQGGVRGSALAALAAPGQLFWSSDGRSVPAAAVPLWERACQIGFEVLGVSAAPFLLPRLIDFCASLAAAVRDQLFHGRTEATPADVEPSAVRPLPPEPEDRALLQRVVAELIERYRAEAVAYAVSPPEREEFEAATVIIRPELAGTASDALDDLLAETVVLSGVHCAANEELTEKVLLAPSALRGQRQQSEPVPEGPDPLETILIPTQRHTAASRTASPPSLDDEPVLETVILAPSGARSAGQQYQPPPGPANADPDKADQPGETVVITPRPKGSRH